MTRSRLLLALKIVLSVVFVGVLINITDPGRVWNVLRRPAAPGWWLTAGILQVGIILLQAWSWRLLFAVRRNMTWRRGVVGTLMVLFAGTFSPGRFSARLSAPFVFRAVGNDRDLGFCASVVYVHTAAYLTAYGITAAVGLALLVLSGLSAPAYLLTVPVAVYLVAGGALIAGARWVGRSGGDVSVNESKYPWPLSAILSGWETVLQDQTRPLDRLTSKVGTLTAVVLLSAAGVSVLPGLRMYGLLRGVDVTFSPWLLMFFLPALYSVTILPISLGGVGLAEGSAVGVLGLLGLDPAIAVPIVLLDRVLAVYLPAFLGWLSFLALPGPSKPLRSATSSEE